MPLALPELRLPDLAGRQTALGDLLGHKTLVFMWGSW